jgi:hypothetical protein
VKIKVMRTVYACRSKNIKKSLKFKAKIVKILKRKIEKRAKKMRNEAKTCENFMLFVSQKEAKIMRNGLRFASILHVAKTKFKRKRDTLVYVRL